MIKEIKELFASPKFAALRNEAVSTNPWFTQEFIDIAIDAISTEFLDEDKVNKFIQDSNIQPPSDKKQAGIICAGNLPLVGFGDLFYALLCGWDVVLKPSSKDPLMRIFGEMECVEVVENTSEFANLDCIILMGSDSTCQTIAEQFPNTPQLLRGSMHSIAIVQSELSSNEITGLFNDIFLYCGRGCRNISHLLIPEGFCIEELAHSLKIAKESAEWDFPKAWYDNYTYEKTVATLTGREFTDTGYCILQNSPKPSTSPIILTYDYFSGEPINSSKIQHIAQVGNFGTAQYPTLWDFANKVSVPDFLLRGLYIQN